MSSGGGRSELVQQLMSQVNGPDPSSAIVNDVSGLLGRGVPTGQFNPVVDSNVGAARFLPDTMNDARTLVGPTGLVDPAALATTQAQPTGILQQPGGGFGRGGGNRFRGNRR